MSLVSLILTHKLLVFFIVASTALCISTIVLGVNVAQLRNELDEEREKKAETTIVTTSPSPPTTQSPAIDMSKYRLPTTVRPTLYDLYLYPDLDTGLFKGTVIISLSVTEPTECIVIHSNGLDITSVTANGEQADFSIEDAYEIVTITRKGGTNFTASFDTMSIEFNGDMKNRIVGLYTSSYTSGGNVTWKYFALSLFYPVISSGTSF